MQRYLYILNVALESVGLNKFRSILTALGIIFGVAAVIAMLAIGNGARQEILEQMKLVGVNNIIINYKSLDNSSGENGDENSEDQKSMTNKFSPGLTLDDARSIREIIPSVHKVSPQVSYKVPAVKSGIQRTVTLNGVEPDFFGVFNLDLLKGQMFSRKHLEKGKPVCIIGSEIKSTFFPQEDPVGKYIKCGNVWLKVVGVLRSRNVSSEFTKSAGISSYSNTVFAPIQTILTRFRDRSIVTADKLEGRNAVAIARNAVIMVESDDEKAGHNQLDKIIVQVDKSQSLAPTSDILNRMLKRRHSGIEDFEIQVPELLLKQEQRTKDIFNIVLGAIASISLIVGGIGIMNIMLASVMERIREIGIRMATGARRKDIIFQFVSEATLISITGGLIGIVFGIALAKIIMSLTDILTIVSWDSILISFGVSVAVGIIFGYMPAKQAAEQDPVASLRYE
ncbi:MAG: ABC transporter permease [Bacteroidales bacterium]|nr:ABC transporter permease [Bacteroidales bacterium]